MKNQSKLQGCTKRIIALADILDIYAKKIGTDMIISSGFRSPEHNAKIGGSTKSLHCLGEAIDFYFENSNMFKHVSPLFQQFISDAGAWQGTTQFEVCRGVVNGVRTNHIHIGFGQENEKISFTGVYVK